MEIIDTLGKFIEGLGQSSNEYVQTIVVVVALISALSLTSYALRGR